MKKRHSLHGRDHLPNGMDPLQINLPWCFGYYDSSQSITADGELRLDNFTTNDASVFELDDDSDVTPSGLLVKTTGLYVLFGYAAGSAGTAKDIYVQTQPASSYPLLGSEDDFNTSVNNFPFNFNVKTLDNTESPITTVALARITVASDAAPSRSILAGVRVAATNYTINYSSLSMIRIGGLS